MTLLGALIMGIIEGITEFLPISSTAHLIIVAKILRVPQTPSVTFFEVFIQSGAILASLVLYFNLLQKHKDLIGKVFISFIPTAIIGLLLHKFVKEVLFESETSIILSLIVGSIMFIILEILIKKRFISTNKDLQDITYQHAIFVGILQSIAIFPGISRAGAVIVAMLLLGYNRKTAAIYSFILAIPTIMGASLLDLVKSLNTGVKIDLLPLTIGLISAYISAYIVIKLFIRFVQNHSLLPFAIYRILLAVSLIPFFWI